MQRAGELLKQCVGLGEVSGGGPGGGLTPCFNRYDYAVQYPEGPDTYTVFTFGIPSNVCAMIQQRQMGVG